MRPGQSPHAGKKMRQIVPYSEALKKLIKKIGVDIADDIPDEHEEDAEFVISQEDEGEEGGKYTGWMRNGKKHGRGTLVGYYISSDDLSRRYDGLWRKGKREGKGREVTEDGSLACEGIWKNNDITEGMMNYDIDGNASQYNGEEWQDVEDEPDGENDQPENQEKQEDDQEE